MEELSVRRVRRARRTRGVWITLGVLIALGGVSIGALTRVFQAKRGEQTGRATPVGVFGTLNDMAQVALEPTGGFVGKNRVNILCMGIDDNWTDSDQVYTAHARTDTLFLLSLDLAKRQASMLSIPRDTYTHIAGTRSSTKINAAYAMGGPERAVATVDELLGVRADHYLVLNIDSTKKMVDALGGVDVNVEHEMHYHDKWGHLSIDLVPGQQHLDGATAVGFARYRHGDAGAKISPEDGDERRMYRQHILMRAMIERAKGFANVAQAPHLVDVAMSTIQTDMTRTQLFDLAAIFKGLQPQDLRTASLTGEDFRGPKGEWFYRLDQDKADAYVRWLIRDDQTAFRSLIPVVVQDAAPDSGAAARALRQLQSAGYDQARIGAAPNSRTVDTAGASSTDLQTATTQIVDQGVVSAQAPQDIGAVLGLSDPSVRREAVRPNRRGWTPPASVVVTLGSDYPSAQNTDQKSASDAGDTLKGQD
ncbi:hypothetical protein CCAX7_001830 [Capsulimonas corticalis]|uniref:Uncharacterized protein n=1 Tax=Capsulimonas corticalis TaxID=2219043 RepID=A0A402CRX5_9BACT|nr:LCP family protein [Capsulimonas corticalis]BDI28132.1 hypothetical protein CCAX7_001830 [Capsulimonas corticalis]